MDRTGALVLTQADGVVELVRDVLDDAVLGIYLYGSAVAGGLKPHSDLDLLAVIRRATTDDEKRSLIARILPRSGRGDPTGRSRSVELTVLVQSDVRPWRYPPRFDVQYGDWLRAEFERGELTPWETPNPDVALLVTQVLAVGRPLVGPAPAVLLDPVPRDDLVRAMLDSIPGLLADLEPDAANVALTLARMWLTTSTGEIRPKDEAADWALVRLPPKHRPVLERARAVYLGEAPDAWEDLRAELRPFADLVTGEVRRLV